MKGITQRFSLEEICEAYYLELKKFKAFVEKNYLEELEDGTISSVYMEPILKAYVKAVGEQEIRRYARTFR